MLCNVMQELQPLMLNRKVSLLLLSSVFDLERLTFCGQPDQYWHGFMINFEESLFAYGLFDLFNCLLELTRKPAHLLSAVSTVQSSREYIFMGMFWAY